MPISFSNVIKLPTCIGSEIPMICNKPSSFQKKKKIYFYVIDYIKAFDCVDHNKLFSQSIQLLSHVQLFANPWAQQASLSITNSQSLLKLMSIESVMPSSHFILCHPLFLPPSLFPSIRVFSKESVFRIS